MATKKELIEKNKHNKHFDVETNNNVFTHFVSVYSQLVVSILVLIIGCIAIFKRGIFTTILFGLVSIEFFILAINNKLIFKRKNVTILYIIMGIMFIIMMLERII